MTKNYFDWLHSQVVFTNNKYEKILLNHLYETKMLVVLDRDNNRCEEGKALRNEYFLETNNNVDYNKDANVLEVLIALARRCDDMSENIRGVEYWFRLFMITLGLDGIPDCEYITESLEMFMKRTYNSDGRGGLFPLKNPKNDQKKVELWYQMAQFINENFDL